MYYYYVRLEKGIGLASATSFSHSNAILVLNNLGVGS